MGTASCAVVSTNQVGPRCSYYAGAEKITTTLAESAKKRKRKGPVNIKGCRDPGLTLNKQAYN